MKKAIKEESVPFDGINSIDLELNFDSQTPQNQEMIPALVSST